MRQQFTTGVVGFDFSTLNDFVFKTMIGGFTLGVVSAGQPGHRKVATDSIEALQH